MNLTETLALLTFILGLLRLIVDVINLTLTVMDRTSQKKNDDNKNLLTACQEKKANKAKKHREKSVTLTDQLPESGWSVLLNKEYQWL